MNSSRVMLPSPSASTDFIIDTMISSGLFGYPICGIQGEKTNLIHNVWCRQKENFTPPGETFEYWNRV